MSEAMCAFGPNFDMSAIRSDAWDDTSPDDELNGFVLEFD